MTETLYATDTAESTNTVLPGNAHGAPDTIWTANSGTTPNWSCRWNMGNPSAALSGTQTVTIPVKKDSSGGNDPNLRVDLYETGVFRRTLFDAAIAFAQDVVVTFDGSEAGGSGVQFRLDCTGGGAGGPTNRRSVQVDAIVWAAEVAGAPVFVPLTGSSAGGSTSTATLTATAELADTSAGASADSATLTQEAELTGATAGSATSTGTLDLVADLAGSSAGSSTATGALSAVAELADTSAGSSTSTGALSAIAEILGESPGTSTSTGALDSDFTLTGASAGASTSVATLSLALSLAGSSAGTASDTPALDLVVGLTGSSAGGSSSPGTLSTDTLKLRTHYEMGSRARGYDEGGTVQQADSTGRTTTWEAAP